MCRLLGRCSFFTTKFNCSLDTRFYVLFPSQFNESFYLGVTNVILFECVFAGVPVLATLQDSPSTFVAIRCLIESFSALGILIPMFAPKIVNLDVVTKGWSKIQRYFSSGRTESSSERDSSTNKASSIEVGVAVTSYNSIKDAAATNPGSGATSSGSGATSPGLKIVSRAAQAGSGKGNVRVTGVKQSAPGGNVNVNQTS
jgi:hypothetical protein